MAASTADILGGILAQVAVIKTDVDKIAKGSKATTSSVARSGLSAKVSPATEAVQQSISALKLMKDVKVTDVAKMSVLPLTKLAWKLRGFADVLGSLDAKTAKNAKATSESIIATLEFLNKANVVKLSMNLLLFPNDRLYKTIHGDDKTKGLIKIVEDTMNSPLGTKTGSEKAKNTITSINNVLEMLGKINTKGLGIKLLLFPKKSIIKFLDDFKEILDSISKNVDSKKTKEQSKTLQEASVLADALSSTAGTFALGTFGFLFGRLGVKAAKGFVKEFAGLGKVLASSFDSKTQKAISESSKNMRTVSTNFMVTMLATAALGPISIIAVPLAALGMLGVMAIIGMQYMTGKMAQMVSKTTKSTNKGLKDILYTSVGFVTLLFATVGVGVFVEKFGGWKAIGFGLVTVAGVMLLYGGIAFLSKFVAKGIESSKKSLVSIFMFAAAGMALIVGSALIAKFAKANAGDILVGLLSIVGVMGVYGLIAFTAGKLKSTMIDGIVGMGIIAAGALMSMGMLAGTVAVNKYANDNGGWLGLIDGVGKIVSVVLAYTALGAAASLVVMGPQAAVFAAGIAGMAMISVIAGLSIGVLAGTVAVTKAANEAGGSKTILSTFKGLTKVMSYLTGREFLKSMMISLKDVGKVMISIPALVGILGAMGSFASVLEHFAGDPGYMRLLKGYDKDGNPIYDNKGVAIKPTSVAIADGFSYFSKTILTALKDITGATRAAKAGKAMAEIMGPVASFADILQKFETTDDGKIKVLHFDAEGNPTEGKVVDIVAVATSISNGFKIFSTTILKGLKDVEMSNREIRKSKKKSEVLSIVFGPITEFTNMIGQFEADSYGNLTMPSDDESGKRRTVNPRTLADAISTGFNYFATKTMQALSTMGTANLSTSSIENKKKSIVAMFQSLGTINDEMKKITLSMDEATQFKNISKEMNDSLISTLDVYKGRDAKYLKDTIKVLDKDHIGYIKKMTDSMKKVKSPMREYIDELNELNESYDKLKKYMDNAGNLVLQVDKHTESHSDVNINESEFATMYDRIAPKIASAVADAIIGLRLSGSSTQQGSSTPPSSISLTLQ